MNDLFIRNTQTTTDVRWRLRVYRPQLTGVAPNIRGFINSPHAFLANSLTALLSTCGDDKHFNDGNLRSMYRWRIRSANDTYYVAVNSNDCELQWRAPYAGRYIVDVYRILARNFCLNIVKVQTLPGRH